MMRKIFPILLLFLTAIPAFASLKNGAAAPRFQAVATDGGKVSLAAYKGKHAVLLYFWDAGFGVCRGALSDLNRHRKSIEQGGAKIFSVNINPSSDGKAESYIKSEKIEIPLLLDSTGQISKLYDVEGVVPTLYLIDASGKIDNQWEGSFSVEHDLMPQVEKTSAHSAAGSRLDFVPIPGEKDEDGATHFAIPETRFEITFPPGWKLRKNTAAKQTHIFMRDPDTKKWSSVVIRVQVDRGKPTPVLMKEYIDKLNQDSNGNFIPIAKPSPVPGRPFAISFAYMQANKYGIEVAHFVLVVPMIFTRKAVWFQYITPATLFKGREKEIQDFIRSVRRVRR